MDPREVHEVLRNSRRRQVIEQLNRRLEPISLRELSEEIAAEETDESPPPRKVRDSVYNSLHQTHLPKLDSMEIVEYDKDRKTIMLRQRAKKVNRYMRVVTNYGVSWSQIYRTLGVIALIAIVGAQTDAPILGSVSVLVLATVFLGLFALVTAYQMWSLRWFYIRALLTDRSNSETAS